MLGTLRLYCDTLINMICWYFDFFDWRPSAEYIELIDALAVIEIAYGSVFSQNEKFAQIFAQVDALCPLSSKKGGNVGNFSKQDGGGVLIYIGCGGCLCGGFVQSNIAKYQIHEFLHLINLRPFLLRLVS